MYESSRSLMANFDFTVRVRVRVMARVRVRVMARVRVRGKR